MELILLFLLPAIILWGVIATPRVSVVTVAALFVVTTICCPEQLFALRAAGLTWTIDRLVLIWLMIAIALAWKSGKVQFYPLNNNDLLLALFLLWLVARTITQPLGSIDTYQPHTLMHLINGYVVPFALYFAIRSAKLDARQMRPALWLIVLMGMYLSLTAIFEVTKVWGLVFPKFIADPTLGIHFGRARGPMLQSVRLGVCLLATMTTVLVFTVWLRPDHKLRWIVALICAPIMLLAIGVTYTRSIWMGLIAIAGILVVLCFQGPVRRGLIAGGFIMGLFAALIIGPNLVAFKREYSAAETRESTYMRAAFAYVSKEMIAERPIAGYGFNQFNVANKPFLTDRSTDIRLESIRNYVHHNSYLSLIVDLGLVGFALFCFVLIGFVRQAWAVWRTTSNPTWTRGVGLTALCITSVHLIQMAFHEVSFSSIENGLLFGSFGLVMAIRRDQFETATADLN